MGRAPAPAPALSPAAALVPENGARPANASSRVQQQSFGRENSSRYGNESENDNEYENQEIFRSLIHVYAKNRESNSYEMLIFDEMRTLKTSLTKLQRLCRAQSAAEILKTI